MTKRMLIDSTNAEETRVVVLDGNRLDEFDLETSTKHQLKGNIYLAKVVRVEPSLQAAFIEYGGNRHGFLAFGEIHPDYYQIPVADRKRLLEAQEQEAREDEEAEERAAAAQDRRGSAALSTPTATADEPGDELADEPEPVSSEVGGADEALIASSNDHPAELETSSETFEAIASEDAVTAEAGSSDVVSDEAGVDPVPPDERVTIAETVSVETTLIVAPEEAAGLFPAEGADDADKAADEANDAIVEESSEPAAILSETADQVEGPAPEQLGGENDTEEQPRRAQPRFLRHYKIQEVIRRRQILLIQVVKEERGSKGAALTTYISLAGRFSVLMPNSPRGGGISRKITSASDRRRLKEVTAELDLPRGMGLIVRTAGANRPKPEILRDCEYLLNQWDQIRELTMKSMAPALIYEEASLIKRAIRDVYSRDVDDILVDGEAGWRAARDFMRMLMPTHARKVQLWKEPQPLFAKAQVEQQLEQMLQPIVQLRSGGYLVINQTEALVAIDVNSGRSTRERGIEETALRTNLEAAEEAARQLRLRDLAGLIVIDFIDMESRRNVAAVERKLKDALKHDRARIQVGGISHFGLLEMSRQRLRPSLTETNFVVCAHCGGTGHVRSTESAALVTLRAIEDEGGRRRASEINLYCASSIALYILNHKRQRLTEIEARYSMLVTFIADDTLLPPQLRIEKVRAQTVTDVAPPIQQLPPPERFEDPDEVGMDADEDDEEAVDETVTATAADDAEASGTETAAEANERRGRRRRRRRGSRREDGSVIAEAGAESGAEGGTEPGDENGAAADTEIGDDEASETAAPADAEPGDGESAASGSANGEAVVEGQPAADTEEGERRRRGRRGGRRRRRDGTDAEGTSQGEPGDENGAADAPAVVPTASLPVYAGPTPANPFGGASAFDIFDAIEQAEEQRLAQPKVTPQPEAPAHEAETPVSEPAVETAVTEATVVPELASELLGMSVEAATPAEPASPEPEPEPEAIAEPVVTAPVVAEPATAAPVIAEPAVAEPEAVAPTQAEAAEPVSGPAIVPVLIGTEPGPTEKKRGWWRR